MKVAETSFLSIKELEKAKQLIEKPLSKESEQNLFKAKVLQFPKNSLKQSSIENEGDLELIELSEDNYASQSVAA